MELPCGTTDAGTIQHAYEREKKKCYKKRIREIEHAVDHFTQLTFSSTGAMAGGMSVFVQYGNSICIHLYCILQGRIQW